jgi:hypothetical protein
MYKAGANESGPEADPKLSDVELLALLTKTQEALERSNGANEADLLLRDFARELMKNRLRVMKLFRP